MKYNKPELLSPAGSFDALIAAVNAGCDAVYLGGKKYGARANATNFTNDDLLVRAIDYAHLKDVKIYYTANTLIKDNEFEDLFNQISFLYKEGIDAIIVQDLGIYNIIKRYFPNLPIHASTQMTIHSLDGILFVENLGFERAVLSRELSLEEIKFIENNSNIELECFIHGALCYSYSGQCLFSSIIGARSGNRGSCAQPCRLPYQLYENDKLISNKKNKYLLSPKDIQTLDILPQLIEAKIKSFKIEGRMKNPSYVGLITSLYRKYIDLYFEKPDAYKIDEKDILNMHQIYNRGGFSRGYYFQKSGKDMMSIKRPNHKGVEIGKVSKIIDNKSLILELQDTVNQGDCLEIEISGDKNYSFIARESIKDSKFKIYLDTKEIKKNATVYRITDVNLLKDIEENIISKERKIIANVSFKAMTGEKSILEIKYKNHNIKVRGSIVETAKTSAISKEKIKMQLSKTGDYPVIIDKLEVLKDNNVFLSIKEINSMRREAIELLITKIVKESKRELDSVKYKEYKRNIKVNALNKGKKACINILTRNMIQFETIKKYPINNIYLELTCFNQEEIEYIADECKRMKVNVFIAFPKIIRKEQTNIILKKLKLLEELKIEGILIRAFDAYNLINNEYKINLDYSFNIFNNEAIDFWNERNVNALSISLELNHRELSNLKTDKLEMLIYGYIPIMSSAQCLNKNIKEICSNNSNDIYLKDRKNIDFKVLNNCIDCTQSIYNSVPLMLIDKYNELKSIGITQFRLEFLDEEPKVIDEIMKYTFGIINQRTLPLTIEGYTRGHYTRGVK